jgi:hypothetical protein
MIKCFQELGDKLAAQFAALNHDSQRFPELATRALEEARLPASVTPEEVVRWACSQRRLPLQADLESTFGEPPVTVYRDDRFYIDAIFWRDASTTIHQHGFCGAFQVLSGSCIHAEFDYQVEDRASVLVGFGQLHQKSLDLLVPGDLRTIWVGDRFIHANYHVESPTITIVARTVGDFWHSPQYSYLKPGVRWTPFAKENSRTRHIQVLRLARSKYPALFLETARSLIDLDITTAFHVFFEVIGNPDEDHFDELLQFAVRRHGARMNLLREALLLERQRKFLTRRRGEGGDDDLNFFVGAVLNASDQPDLLGLLRRRFPERAADQLLVDLAWRTLEPLVQGRSEAVQTLVRRTLSLVLGEGRTAAEGADILQREFSLTAEDTTPILELASRVEPAPAARRKAA